MKKSRIVLPALAVLFLSTASACSFSTGTKPSTTPATVTLDPTTTKTRELVEVNDCEDVESGNYYVSSEIYTINKTTKKLKSVTYEGNEYSKYIAGQGTLNFEVDIKFVEYGDTHAIYFTKDNKENFIYKTTSLIGKETFEMSTVTSSSTGSSSLSTYIHKMPTTFPTITYGSYISGLVKEQYYYHFDLTETSIKVYVSESAETHAETPTYEQNNYKVVFNQAALLIQVPKEPKYTCTISFAASDNSVKFTDSYSEGCTYSGSGTLTLKETA